MMTVESPHKKPRPENRAEATVGRFLIAMAVVLALKWGTLFQPPVWDTAMGMFPAAVTLAHNGFDLIALERMPRYADGGPNTHSTSPVTWVTALALRVVGEGPWTLAILHLLHFAFAALALLALLRLVRPVFGTATALLLCLAVLLHPTFSAQVGYLYLELPLFLCAVSALAAWTEQRLWPAAIWAALAFAIKETGAIVPATLVVATLLERRSLSDKGARIARVALLPVLWMAGRMLLRAVAVGPSEALAIVPPLNTVFRSLGHYLSRFVLNVPDLLAYLAVFLVAALWDGRSMLRALRSEPMTPGARTSQHYEALVMGYSAVLITFFVAFFAVLPAVAAYTVLLPRYWVVILPFLLLWVGFALRRAVGDRVSSAPALAFAVLAGLFVINANGALYPSDVDTEGPGNDPPLTERSNSYRRLLALERQAIHALEALPSDAPVYYGHYEHYLLTYPALGYASGPLPNGHDLSTESLAPVVTAESFPPCSYALYNYPWLGGRSVLGLIRFAETRPHLSAEVVREFRDPPYVITLVAIRAGDADCSL